MVLAALAGAVAVPAVAAAQSAYARVQHTIEGYWNIDDAARTASLRAAKAELSPAGLELQKRNQATQAAAAAAAAAARAAAGGGNYAGLAAYICDISGVPNVYTTSEPWTLIVAKDRVIQSPERYSLPPRQFYTDGRSWPDFSKLPPSVNGYAIARWEGKDLVVDTRNLPPGNLPGGGLKAATTTLTERFSVDPTGQRLTVTFTVTDPVLLAKPYSYQIGYDRAPEHTFAYGNFCDPNEEPARMIPIGGAAQ